MNGERKRAESFASSRENSVGKIFKKQTILGKSVSCQAAGWLVGWEEGEERREGAQVA